MRRIETFEPRPGVAYALLVAMTVIWGSGMVLARGVNEHIPPIGLGFWRLTVACIVLLPLVLPHLLSQGPLLRRHGIRCTRTSKPILRHGNLRQPTASTGRTYQANNIL